MKNLMYLRVDDYENHEYWGRDWEQGFNDGAAGECLPPVLLPTDPHPYNAYLQGWRSAQEYLVIRDQLQGVF